MRCYGKVVPRCNNNCEVEGPIQRQLCVELHKLVGMNRRIHSLYV